MTPSNLNLAQVVDRPENPVPKSSSQILMPRWRRSDSVLDASTWSCKQTALGQFQAEAGRVPTRIGSVRQ